VVAATYRFTLKESSTLWPRSNVSPAASSSYMVCGEHNSHFSITNHIQNSAVLGHTVENTMIGELGNLPHLQVFNTSEETQCIYQIDGLIIRLKSLDANT